MTASGFRVSLTVCLPSDSAGIRLVRQVMDNALVVLGVTAACRGEIAVALTEACDNVVAHARFTEQYEVTVKIAGEVCMIDVTDTGVGFVPPHRSFALPPVEAESGRGLYLIAALTDRFELQSQPGHGTTVRFAKQLSFTPNPN
jgi:serine/threonine-protein kinase RsbW